MKVVIDSNVLLQIIPKKSPYRVIFDYLISEKIILVVSNEILLEYEEVLQRELNVGISENVLKLLETLPSTEKHEIFYRWNLIKEDYDDNKFADTAINSGADYLITYDNHFNVLNNLTFPKVNIINADVFLTILSELR